MSEKKVIVTVEENERRKIYRLNRRLAGLNELLATIDNTKITFKDSENMKVSIKKDIIDCKNRINKWWNIIGEKYKLSKNKQFLVTYITGDIIEA